MEYIIYIICVLIGIYSCVKWQRLKNNEADKAHKYYMCTIFFLGILIPLRLTFVMFN